jgi:hypothetical protein
VRVPFLRTFNSDEENEMDASKRGDNFLKEDFERIKRWSKKELEHVFHTTFESDDDVDEDEDDEDFATRRRKKNNETDGVEIVQHELPESIVEAHEMTNEERKREEEEKEEKLSSLDAVEKTTVVVANKPHLARGWIVSKLPFDVDQPGSERTALEAYF